jgi:hypothetical protein
MRAPIDVATRVSAQLSDLIEKMVNDPDREQPPTLGEVRVALRDTVGRVAAEAASLHPQDRTSMIVELDELIEEYGEEVPAIDFVAAKASEALSRIIEAAMDDPSLPEAPTLARVRDAVVSGLTARLVGEGTIEPDEDATLLEEIDELIRRFGADAVAEDFIRFE